MMNRCINKRMLNHIKFCNFSTATSNSKIVNESISTSTFGGKSKEEFRNLCENSSEFVKTVLGAKITNLEKGKLTMILPFKKEFIGNPLIPCLHGGTTASMLDHASSFCGWSMLNDSNQALTTADLRIDYLNPAPCEDLYFDASVNHLSTKLIRIDSVCYNNNRSKKIAVGRGLYSIQLKDTAIK